MTTFNEVFHGEKQVVISWTLPPFLPDHYVDIVSCTLWCDSTTYYLSEMVTNNMYLSIIVYGVHPGSICLIKHLTVYNPASIDLGIGLIVHTPYSSKFWIVNFDIYMFFNFYISKLTYVHVCISLLYHCANTVEGKFLCFSAFQSFVFGPSDISSKQKRVLFVPFRNFINFTLLICL